jgi:hypothetical protein
VVNWQTYTYYVTAIYSGGAESIPSNVITVIPMPQIAFPFFDNFETGGLFWIKQEPWGLSTSSFHSPDNSMTDSPSGQYENNINITTTLRTVDLKYYTGASISFWTKYALEEGYDYVYLEVSINGIDWSQLASFNGTQNSWVQKSYSLDPYLGNPNVTLRFRIFTDVGYQMDGIYIDDFELNVEGIGIAEQQDQSRSGINGVYPNPSNGQTNISIVLVKDDYLFVEIYDLFGQKVKSINNKFLIKGTYTMTWDGTNEFNIPVGNGIYFIRMHAGDNISQKKVIIMN